MPTTANPPKPRVAPSGMSRTASSKLEKTLLLALIPPPWIILPSSSTIMRQASVRGNPLAMPPPPHPCHPGRHEPQHSRPVGTRWLVEPHLFHLLYQVEIRSQPVGRQIRAAVAEPAVHRNCVYHNNRILSRNQEVAGDNPLDGRGADGCRGMAAEARARAIRAGVPHKRDRYEGIAEPDR